MGGYDPIFGMMHRRSSMSEQTMEEVAKPDAEAAALRFLAEMHCPEDVVRYGEAHRLPAFAEMTWLNGFQAGWRACHSRTDDAAIKRILDMSDEEAFASVPAADIDRMREIAQKAIDRR